MEVVFNNLIDIYEKEVSKNTKNKKKIYNFEKYKIINIFDIKKIIEEENYNIYRYNIFYVSVPKYRIVMSLNIKDKVINHYIARFILINKLDKYLDIRNCATRKNMGYDYAIKLLKKYLECNKKYTKLYVLKLDISKYFYSIDHDILKGLLIDKLSNEEYNIICNIINSTNYSYINDKIINIKRILIAKDVKRKKEIDSIPIYNHNKGLPIGNMTSQFLSIFYLYKLDHFIVNNLKLKYMIRYMDDYIIISDNKEYLKHYYKIIEYKLETEYKLKLNKNKSMIIPCSNGFEFLGYIFKIKNKKTIIKVKSSNKKRLNKNIKKNNYLYKNNIIPYRKYFSSMMNYYNSYKYKL